jgi:hypothetical protein
MERLFVIDSCLPCVFGQLKKGKESSSLCDLIFICERKNSRGTLAAALAENLCTIAWPGLNIHINIQKNLSALL